jgi:signal peptidase I
VLRGLTIGLLIAVFFVAFGVLNEYYSGISPLYMGIGYSMYPTILNLDLVFVVPKPLLTQKDIDVGDIIVFKEPFSNRTIIHRVIEVVGGYLYRTKGDNNPVADPYYITFDRVLGKVITVYGNPVRINVIVLSGILVGLDLVTSKRRW